AWHLFGDGAPHVLHQEDPLAGAQDAGRHGGLVAPMPGRVIALLAEPGRVKAGAPLLVVEAMKMEHTITAPVDGILAGYRVAVGEQVDDGATLVDFQAGDETP